MNLMSRLEWLERIAETKRKPRNGVLYQIRFGDDAASARERAVAEFRAKNDGAEPSELTDLICIHLVSPSDPAEWREPRR